MGLAMSQNLITHVVCGVMCLTTSLALTCTADAARLPSEDLRVIQIGAGPLEPALRELERVSEMRVEFEKSAVAGRRTSGCAAAEGGPAALSQLLRGSGLIYVMRADDHAMVEDILLVQQARDTATDLEEIVVQGQGGRSGAANATGYGPANGFVASRSLSSTKTDTPLIETPQSIAIIPAEQIKAQGAQTIGAALRYSAGVSGEVYGPDIRGFGFQVRGFEVGDEIFYRDGMRLTGTDFASFSSLDPYGAERLEILRGPSSVLYGQNAPAGILNYVSKRPTDYAFGEASASLGSFDRYEGQFDVGGPLAGTDGVWSYRLTALFRDGRTQVDHFDDDRVFIAPAVTWKPNEDTTLTILGNYQKDDQGYSVQFLPALGTLYKNKGRYLPMSRLTGEPGDYYRLEQAQLSYLFEHKVNDGLTVRQNARYAWLKNAQEGSYGTGYIPGGGDLYGRIADFGRSSIDSFAIDNQAQVKFDAGPLNHTLLVGVDHRYGRYDDKGGDDSGSKNPIGPIDIFNPVYGLSRHGKFSLYQDTRTTQLQTGLYGQDQIRFGNWVATLGGRQDWTSTDTDDRLSPKSSTKQHDTAFTGRAGLVYLFDSGLAPYVSYSESFFPILGVDRTTGSPFKPETGQQYEAGVKYQPTGWNSSVTASVFDLKRQNFTRTVGRITTQTGEVGSKGVELEAVASLKSGWNATLAYSYVDAEVTSGDKGVEGKTPPTIPTHRFSAWTDYTAQTGALKGVGFGAGVRVNGRTWGDDVNSFKVPAVALFDASASYERDRYRFQINATNVFDKRYVAACLGASAYCYYGESRKIIGKLTYSW